MYAGTLNHNKWYPAHTRAALTWTLTQQYVPIYPKQMESIFGKIPVNAFHVTSPENITSVKDILGKKKAISTFTKTNKSSQLAKGRGVQTGSGGVIFYVEGLMLARKYMDFETVPDKSGIRWVMGRHIFDGDNMIVQNAVQKAGLYDNSTWRDLEWDIEKKHSMADHDSFKDYENAIKKEVGVLANKQIKKYIDVTNKLLKDKKDMVQKSVRNPSDRNSKWWNEVLVYNTKVIDCFVLKRVYDDYYFQNDTTTGYDKNVTLSYKNELLKIVPESKITIGTPAQFRKWYTAREGELTLDD